MKNHGRSGYIIGHFLMNSNCSGKEIKYIDGDGCMTIHTHFLESHYILSKLEGTVQTYTQLLDLGSDQGPDETLSCRFNIPYF